MKNKQESRFSMYLTTADYCELKNEITAPLPNFSTTFSKFKTICDKIDQMAKAQMVNTTGTTANKAELKKLLIVPAVDTARKLMAYAKLTKNQQLLKEISFTESSLRRMPDTTLAQAAQLIYDRAETYLSLLAGYLVNTETQAALLGAINAYRAALSAPRIETTTQVQATQKLVELFKTGDEALADMDAVVEIIRISQPDFYTGYKAARKVVNTGVGTLAVKGLVIDSQTSAPIKGVSVSFALDGGMLKTGGIENATVMVKKTAEKGGFNVQTLVAGTYLVTLKKTGYADQTVTIYVNDGELTIVDVKLDKI